MKTLSISILFLLLACRLTLYAQSAKHSPHVVDTTGRFYRDTFLTFQFSNGNKFAANAFYMPISITDSGFFFTDHVSPDGMGMWRPNGLPKYIRHGKYLITLSELSEDYEADLGMWSESNTPPKLKEDTAKWFSPPIGYGGSSETPRLDALEKQVQFLIRRTNELESDFLAEDSAGRTYFVHGKKMAPAPMILEQRVEFLERRVRELELEIKQGKADTTYWDKNCDTCPLHPKTAGDSAKWERSHPNPR